MGKFFYLLSYRYSVFHSYCHFSTPGHLVSVHLHYIHICLIPAIAFQYILSQSSQKIQNWSQSSTARKSLLSHHSRLLSLTFKAFYPLQSLPHLFSRFYSGPLPNHSPHTPDRHIKNVNQTMSLYVYKNSIVYFPLLLEYSLTCILQPKQSMIWP